MDHPPKKRQYNFKIKNHPWRWLSPETIAKQKERELSRPPPPPDIKTLKEFRRKELEIKLNELLLLTPADLAKILADPASTVIDLALARVATEATSASPLADNVKHLDWLMNRLIGKVQEKVDISHQHNFVLPTPQEARRILDDDPCAQMIEAPKPEEI